MELLLYIGALLTAIGPAETHSPEGYVSVAEQELNGVHVQVSQIPSDPVVGQVQFRINLRDAKNGEPFMNARVRAYATSPDPAAERLVSPAISTPIMPSVYEALLNVATEGTWRFEVQIEGYGSVYFETVVGNRLRSGENIAFAGYLFYAVQVLFVVAVIVLFWTARKRRLKRSST